MSIKQCEAISPRPDSQYRPQDEDALDGELLKVPRNVLEHIGNFVATGETPLEAATNGVLWSRVCVYTHVTSHQSGMTQQVQQALEDDALLKIWDTLSSDGDFNENPGPQTLAEIKAWYDDPANADLLNSIVALDLSNLGLKAIPPQITKYTQLRQLNLSNNQITDVSALENFTQLARLNLSHNQITDIAVLGNLTQLSRLNLSSNKITDVAGLGILARLEELNLYDNQITDVSALGNLVQLCKLNLSNNQITDVSTLGNLVQLCKLNLSNNQVTDISALGHLEVWISL
ncbi:MAG: leucine-rich repeat domain-containing protein [Verrucomicrobia bacterium]|nr:leucine-rich repeat domain-containing protein [Verrucomicrobiota bacterium]